MLLWRNRQWSRWEGNALRKPLGGVRETREQVGQEHRGEEWVMVDEYMNHKETHFEIGTIQASKVISIDKTSSLVEYC